MVKKVVLSDQDSDQDEYDLPQIVTKAEASAKYKAQNLNFTQKTEHIAKRNRDEKQPLIAKNNDLFSQNLDDAALKDIQNRKQAAESQAQILKQIAERRE